MSFAKLGGFFSVVDESLYIETKKGNKRVIHFRSTEYPARTLLEDLPNSTPVDSFNLHDHVQLLLASRSAASEYEL